MADLAFILVGVVAFALMALFVRVVEMLVQSSDDRGGGR